MTDPRILQGVGVSPGIAAGPAMVLRRELPHVPDCVIAPDAVEAEVARLHDAVDTVRRGLEDLQGRAQQRLGPEEAKIFDAQILMLQDEEFLQGAERLMRDNQLSAERAFEFKALEVRALWTSSRNDRLRDRVADLSALQLRVLNHLLGRAADELQSPDGSRPVIVFTRELSPFLTIEFERDHVIAFVGEEGTRTSHAAIIARSLGIPCVMGLTGALDAVQSGNEVLVDGTRGTVIVRPTADQSQAALQLAARRKVLLHQMGAGQEQRAATADGVRVGLYGNLDLPEELDLLGRSGVDGIGLLRTEFLIAGRADLPDENEQLDYFRRVVRRFPDRPVVVRSYDVGGDKFPAAFRIPPEPNPFLGWRALRVCLDRPEVFLPQLRALLRARIDGDVRLMLPLVIDADEVRQSRALVAEARASLSRDGLRAADDLPVGVMVETPAAVLMADRLAAVSDFLSVGTNDLTQYTLAVDRGNARLAHRFTALHPAVVRMLHSLRETAARADRPINICGELAGEPLGTFLLMGLGYRSVSVAPWAVPVVRWLLRRIDAAAAAEAAAAALHADAVSDVVRGLSDVLGATVDLESLDAGWLPGPRGETTLE